MKNRFKKLICITLIIIMVFAYAPMETSASYKYTSYNDIDITPLNIYYGSFDVELTILRGGLPGFKGGIRDISKEELDKLCAEVIREMNVSEWEIKDSQVAYKEFDELATKLDGMAYGDGALKAALLAAIGVIPGAGGVIGTWGGAGYSSIDGGWTSVPANLGWAGLSTGGAIVGGAFGGPIGAAIGSLFVSLAQFGYEQYKLYEMRQEVQQKLVQSSLYLSFLSRLWRKIENYKRTHRLEGREIVFTNALSGRTFYFYNVGGNNCAWVLNMTLKKIDSSPGLEGTYTGDFHIFVIYDMIGFLKNPKEAANNATNGGLTALEASSYSMEGHVGTWTTSPYYKDSGGVAEIERTITGKATAVIDAYNMVDFKFEQNDDLKSVNIDNLGFTINVVASAPEIGLYWDAGGDFVFHSNYSGSDNPPIRIEGQGDTRWWLHSGFGSMEGNSRELWENNIKNSVNAVTFDEQAWRPWDIPNPPAQMRIMKK